jgi:hypothetical protein
VGETTIAAIHGSRANRAGSFSNTMCPVRFEDVPADYEQRIVGYVCLEPDQLCLPKIPSQWRKHRINNIQVQRVAAEPLM